nr:hypothetical protein [Alicyclobacillus macrosporangiidus]
MMAVEGVSEKVRLVSQEVIFFLVYNLKCMPFIEASPNGVFSFNPCGQLVETWDGLQQVMEECRTNPRAVSSWYCVYPNELKGRVTVRMWDDLRKGDDFAIGVRGHVEKRMGSFVVPGDGPRQVFHRIGGRDELMDDVLRVNGLVRVSPRFHGNGRNGIRVTEFCRTDLIVFHTLTPFSK